MLKGKNVIVTGANQGIGKAIALALGNQGAFVIGTAPTTEGAEMISRDLERDRSNGEGIKLRFPCPEGIEKFGKEILEKYSDIDILVNNAGIVKDSMFMRMSLDSWRSVMEINLESAFLLSKKFIGPMIRKRWGRIVNISSIVGISGNAGQANYSASKAGLIGMSRSLAKEVGKRGVTVNLIAPGFIETQMTAELDESQRNLWLEQIPIQRIGQPEDVAAAVLFLVGDGASYISGQIIHVDGGMHMSA